MGHSQEAAAALFGSFGAEVAATGDAEDAAGACPRTTLEKTSAVLVRLEGGAGRIMGERASAPIPPLEGSTAAIADGLREYAALGLAEVQLVVDPITQGSIEALGAVLADLDRG